MATNLSRIERSSWLAPVMLFLVALVLRAQTFGHPLLHMDEDFYLLVGNRMITQDAWPYVDIWDRKPFGLFLLFAGFAAVGKQGFLAYQLGACLAVAATGWLLYGIATRIVDRSYALLAAILYICYLPFFGGYGGQSPVFYNLLIAGAVLIVLTTLGDRDRPDAMSGMALFWRGASAMLLVGMALQIKYSVVFEGIFLGLLLMWPVRGKTAPVVALYVTGWVAMALLPTAAAYLVYVAAGYEEAFVHANFISIFQRTSGFDGLALKRILSLIGLLAPILILSALAFKVRPDRPGTIAIMWALVAIGAFLIFGTYYNHYGLALVLPLAVTAAMGVSTLRPRPGMLAGLALIFMAAGTIATHVKLSRKGTSRDLDAILARAPEGGGTCPWYMGVTSASLYLRSESCLPTRYALSGHLFETHERFAIGVDQVGEIKAILARRPPLITLDETPRPEENLALRAAFMRTLNTSYTLVDRRKTGRSNVLVYVLK